MKKVIYVLMAISLLVGIIGLVGCGEGTEEATPTPTPSPTLTPSPEPEPAPITTPTPTPTPTLLPQIGDKVTSGSIQASVLRIEETHSISGSDIRIDSEEGFILIPVTVKLENQGETSVGLTLAPGSTTLRDAQQQYLLESVGVSLKGSCYFVYGSSGQMSRAPIDESWKLTGDFTKDVWAITLMANSHIEIILVYSVPTGSSGFELSLPGFVPISLED